MNEDVEDNNNNERSNDKRGEGKGILMNEHVGNKGRKNNTK